MKNVRELALAAVVACSACSSKIDIEGEAFVEHNGAATKLANVEIQIIPEEEFVKFIKSKLGSIDGEVAKINSQIELREKSIADLRKSTQAVWDAQMKMANLGASWNVNTLGGQYYQQQQNAILADSSASVGKSTEAIVRNEQDVEKLKESIRGLKTGKNAGFYYSDKIPGAILKVSTNSDGKFKIDAPTGKRAALVAFKGERYWFLWVTPKGAKNLNLTNGNSADTDCEICIFNDKSSPESL